MVPNFEIKSVTFNGGEVIQIEPNSITVLVGPNNSGKTSTLREIQRAIRNGEVGPVVTEIVTKKSGSTQELDQWLLKNIGTIIIGEYPSYSWLGEDCLVSLLSDSWSGKNLGRLTNILTTMLAVEKRLETVQPQDVINFIDDAPKHPMHVLYLNDELEKKIDNYLQMAFGAGLTLNRGAGMRPPLHFGGTPKPTPGEDRVSMSYIRRLGELPLLHEQGHGIRSFAGCVIHSLASPAFVHLIDEPEVFLHPAQARLLGGLLTKLTSNPRQIFIATHSGDFLRGVIDSKDAPINVIRLTREGNINHAHQLDVTKIRSLWSDPILRFSNVLDGVYHEMVVVCEADSDCRFYSAVMETVCEQQNQAVPDVLFAASGGKHRIPVVVKSLVSLGVRTRVITDFDALRDQQPLQEIILALGKDWEDYHEEWNRVKKSVEQKNLPLNVLQVKERIENILNKESSTLTDDTIEEIKKTLRVSSQWEQAKLAGVNAVFSGEPRSSLNSLLLRLQEIGLFIVECGEIERFAPSVGGHGPKWISEVLKKDLANDPELCEARQFVAKVLDISRSTDAAKPPLQPAIDQDKFKNVKDRARQSRNSSTKSEKVGEKTEQGFWYHLLAAFRSLRRKKN